MTIVFDDGYARLINGDVLTSLRELPDASVRAKEQAVALSEAGRTQRWRELAYEAVRRCAQEHETFTADLVWQYVPARDRKGESRALGAILKRAHKDGIIRFVGYGKTGRVSSHRATVSVWARA